MGVVSLTQSVLTSCQITSITDNKTLCITLTWDLLLFAYSSSSSYRVTSFISLVHLSMPGMIKMRHQILKKSSRISSRTHKNVSRMSFPMLRVLSPMRLKRLKNSSVEIIFTKQYKLKEDYE